MEACLQREPRIAPFGDHGGFRIVAVQHFPDISPDGTGAGLFLIVVLHQGGGHVHTETVTPPVEPETHDVLHGLSGGGTVRMIGGELPRLLRI